MECHHKLIQLANIQISSGQTQSRQHAIRTKKYHNHLGDTVDADRQQAQRWDAGYDGENRSDRERDVELLKEMSEDVEVDRAMAPRGGTEKSAKSIEDGTLKGKSWAATIGE